MHFETILRAAIVTTIFGDRLKHKNISDDFSYLFWI